jgi:protein-tyrosine phosphatase
MSWWGRNFGGMDAVEVIPGLRMGAAPSRRAARRLARAGVTHAIDLRRHEDAISVTIWPEYVFTHSYPLKEYDAPDIAELREVSSDVASLIAQGEVVYVHCRAGVQRAPTVACAVLIQMGWSLADAYRVVSSRRAVTAMSEGQLAVLRQFADVVVRLPGQGAHNLTTRSAP